MRSTQGYSLQHNLKWLKIQLFISRGMDKSMTAYTVVGMNRVCNMTSEKSKFEGLGMARFILFNFNDTPKQ